MRNWWGALGMVALYVVLWRLLFVTEQPQWRPFTCPQGGFAVTMPGEAKEEIVPLDTMFGRIDQHRFIVRSVSGMRTYFACYQNQSAVLARRPPQLSLHLVADRWREKAQGGKLLTCRPCSVQGFPGQEVSLINLHGYFIIVRMVVAHRRFCQVMVSVRGALAPNADDMKFLDSFRILQ